MENFCISCGHRQHSHDHLSQNGPDRHNHVYVGMFVECDLTRHRMLDTSDRRQRISQPGHSGPARDLEPRPHRSDPDTQRMENPWTPTRPAAPACASGTSTAARRRFCSRYTFIRDRTRCVAHTAIRPRILIPAELLRGSLGRYDTVNTGDCSGGDSDEGSAGGGVKFCAQARVVLRHRFGAHHKQWRRAGAPVPGSFLLAPRT